VTCSDVSEVSAVSGLRLPGAVTAAWIVGPVHGDGRLSARDQQRPTAGERTQRRRQAGLLLSRPCRRTSRIHVRAITCCHLSFSILLLSKMSL